MLLIGICPTCGKESEFKSEREGWQEIPEYARGKAGLPDRPRVLQVTCQKCGSTTYQHNIRASENRERPKE